MGVNSSIEGSNPSFSAPASRGSVGPGSERATLSVARRGGRAVECGGLENRYGSLGSSRVQIPPSPLIRAGTRSTRRDSGDGSRLSVLPGGSRRYSHPPCLHGAAPADGPRVVAPRWVWRCPRRGVGGVLLDVGRRPARGAVGAIDGAFVASSLVVAPVTAWAMMSDIRASKGFVGTRGRAGRPGGVRARYVGERRGGGAPPTMSENVCAGRHRSVLDRESRSRVPTLAAAGVASTRGSRGSYGVGLDRQLGRRPPRELDVRKLQMSDELELGGGSRSADLRCQSRAMTVELLGLLLVKAVDSLRARGSRVRWVGGAVLASSPRSLATSLPSRRSPSSV